MSNLGPPLKFSIVTISFNQAVFLEHAIRSVIEQDYPHVEYIVVDPGSTDGSREIIERYRNRIDHIVFEPDSGPADGLNKGFSHATGDIYGFLNSDDLLEPGALSRVEHTLRKYPDVDVVSGHGWVVDEDGCELRRIYSDRFTRLMAAYGACILVQPSTFFRSSVFNGVNGFNCQNRSNWDAELFVDISLTGARFARIPAMLSRYRIHMDSITGSAKLSDLHILHRAKMLEKIMRRKPSRADGILRFVARYFRKVTNPRDTWERLRRGPLFGTAR